ncbi:MAG TPA: glycosyltransferase family 4 protein [Candidatus Sulfotelmatobacter sp.]|nr:glycosyltransferase family 4 protein [Candidatus Sulfotelmatobacter sp.]
MKILWVKGDRLLPVQNGGNIRSYHIARHLARQHSLTFFSYYSGTKDGAYESELKAQFPDSLALYTGTPEFASWKRAAHYLSHLSDPVPYAVSRFWFERVQKQLREWFLQRAFDVVVCDFLDAAVNFPEQLTIPTVLFQHNVESEIWRRHAENGSGWLKGTAYRIEFSKMQKYEQEMVRRFQHVIAVSENDATLMSAWVDPSHISVVPTGVDLSKFQPDLRRTAVQPVVMFVGAMDWMPNADAVEYFCREIWPRVLERIPDARFRIVGRNPSSRIQALASSNIEVTGLVPSVTEHLRDAAVVVVPLRVGGGTRLKIYEAMAMGRAVVSTTIGAEGLDVHDGRDIVLADDPGRFAEEVVHLLADDSLRQRYERAAAELAAKYDWTAVASRFGEVLQQIAGVSKEALLSH